MKTGPVIGVSCGLRESAEPEFYLPIRYVASVESAGGVPVVLPVTSTATLADLIELLDGIVIIGGPDLPPDCYGEDLDGSEDLAPRVRAEFDLELARRAVDSNTPLLGICYGHQVLNVALGGKLVQDIPRTIPHSIKHRKLGEEETAMHEVRLEANSRLARIIGRASIESASSHHQSVSEPGRELVPVAYAGDGVLEATEHTAKNFVIGVQWHPEMTPEAEHSRRLFAAFVEAARQRRLAR